MPHKITPFIRCTDNAKEIADFYMDIFPDATITKTNPIVVSFEIFGQSLATLNGGEHPEGKINPSISFSLRITDQELTKQLRDKLSEGGSVLMEFGEYPRSPAYGRCNDKYGVSRQVMYDNRPDRNNMLVPSFMFTGANNGKAQEAMDVYTSIFPASHIDFVWKYEEGMGETPGNIAHAEFTLVKQTFIAQESGLEHKFAFNDGISLMVSCKDQAEVDYYRDALTADGGHEVQCGWLKDKYGVSRQIVPVGIDELLFNSDTAKANRAMQAMLQMKKLDIQTLQDA